jgi:ATP-dependent Clp protease protease subunit
MSSKVKNQKYWEFKNQSGDSADLYLYIEIASWGGGYSAHSAKSFKDELDSLGEISTLNVYINSPGGDVFEGNAIYNMLKRHKAHVNVHVDALAASIASVIAMAGDTIYMPGNTMMMIHNAWSYTAGDSNDLRELADTLDKVNKSLKQAYLEKAGDKLDEDTLTKLMDSTTWLTAKECYDYGLCDVVQPDIKVSACLNREDLEKYKNAPKALLEQFSNKAKDQVVKDEEIEAIISRVNNIVKFEEENIYE